MEIDKRKIRLSKSGYSIKSGWSEEKRIIAICPHSYEDICKQPELFKQWMEDAEKLIDAYNNSLSTI